MKFYQSCLGTVTKLTMRRGEDQYNEIIEHFFFSHVCSFTDGDSVILAGGYAKGYTTKVTRYNMQVKN